MNRYTLAKRGLCVVLYASCIALSRFVSFSLIIGSYAVRFSGINCVAPIGGVFLGVGGSFMTFVVQRLARVAVCGVAGLYSLYGLPTLCASLYCATTHWLIRLVLPLGCMMLFWLHPTGWAAGLYAFYWFIPVALFFVRQQSLFLTSLGSTFVAHAVGSVIWIYTVEMSASAWLALIPVVAVERLLFATGMVIIHHVISAASSAVESYHSSILIRLKKTFNIA